MVSGWAGKGRAHHRSVLLLLPTRAGRGRLEARVGGTPLGGSLDKEGTHLNLSRWRWEGGPGLRPRLWGFEQASRSMGEGEKDREGG